MLIVSLVAVTVAVAIVAFAQEDAVYLNITYTSGRPQTIYDNLYNMISVTVTGNGRPPTVNDYARNLYVSVFGRGRPPTLQDTVTISLGGLAAGHKSVLLFNNTLYACNPGEAYVSTVFSGNYSVEILYNGDALAAKNCTGPCLTILRFTPGFNPVLTVKINSTVYNLALNLVNTTRLEDVRWSTNGFSLSFSARVLLAGTSLPAPCETVNVYRNGTLVATLTPNSNGRVSYTTDVEPGTWEYCAHPVHSPASYCKTVSNIVTVTVTIPSFNATGPGLGNPQSLYVALVSAVIYLYFATRWNNPFLALIPFGLIIYGYGAVTRSYYLAVLGGAALIAGALINYLRGRGS